MGDIQMAQQYLFKHPRPSMVITCLFFNGRESVGKYHKFQIQIKLIKCCFRGFLRCFPRNFPDVFPETSGSFSHVLFSPQVAANQRMAGMAKEVFSLCTLKDDSQGFSVFLGFLLLKSEKCTIDVLNSIDVLNVV